MFGPYVCHGAGKVQAKLIAFLDDASRVCCHGEFFLADNTEMLLGAFKSALYKRGLCECLYVDHGLLMIARTRGNSVNFTGEKRTGACEVHR